MTSTESIAVGDLDTVMASVGNQIFSYLPLGSLLSGSSSPMLVNTTFHDCIFQCLGQYESLSLSACSHLRKINDDQLIGLVRKIIEVQNGASCTPHTQAQDDASVVAVRRRRTHHACLGSGNCTQSTIKVRHLDLSRCRSILGGGVSYCLQHMPNIEQIILASASRFSCSENDFASGLELNKLEFLDISGCSRVDSVGFRDILTRTVPRANNIRHLDLSGCSARIDDSIVDPLLRCINLECLNLSGSKITEAGLGALCYVHREKLKRLSLRECKEIHLPRLLCTVFDEISRLVVDHSQNAIDSGDFQRFIPEKLLKSVPPGKCNIYFLSLIAVMSMRSEHYGGEQLVDLSIASDNLMASFKGKDEEVHGQNNNNRKGRMFGNLEMLDISLVGNRRIKLQGCASMIAWLNGGLLTEVSDPIFCSILLAL